MKQNLYNVYVPILEKIYNEANQVEDIDKNPDIPDIFIPGAGKLYNSCNKKILYIGIDTNGWFNLKESAKNIVQQEIKNPNKKY